MKAVILAGGRGSRFGQITDRIPKPLIQVAGLPLISRLLNVMPKQIDSCIIVTGYLGSLIKSFLGGMYNGLKLTYIEQNTGGTAGALISAKNELSDNDLFLVIGSDDIFGKNELAKLISFQPTYGIHFGCHKSVTHYGIKLDKEGYFRGFKYNPSENQGSRFAGVGAYCLSPAFFEQKIITSTGGERDKRGQVPFPLI